MSTPSRRAPRDGLLAFVAVGWSIGIGIFWLVVPSATSQSVSVSRAASTSGRAITREPDGAVTTTTSTETLLESEGLGVLALLAIPLVIALVGGIVAGRRARAARLGAGSALAAFSLLGAMSIGLFYAPAALVLLAAGVSTPKATATPAAAGAPSSGSRSEGYRG